MRLTAERAGTGASLKLKSSRCTQEDDEVIEEHGARVFVEAEGPSLLEDRVLDANVDHNSGRVPY